MITIFLIFLSCLYSCTLQQDNMDNKYQSAYNYILSSEQAKAFFDDVVPQEGKLPLVVSDQIVNMDYTPFYRDIYSRGLYTGDKSKTELLDSLIVFDNREKFESFKMEELNKFNTLKNPKLILFFSKPQNNTLSAELLVGNDIAKPCEEYRFFNRGIRYLIYFDEDDKVKDVFTKEWHYN